MTQWGLDSLFNPAKRHMDEEKRRLQATREEIGDSSGGKRIDLESGKVKIRRATPKPSSDADAEAETQTETDADVDTDDAADIDTDDAAHDAAEGAEARVDDAEDTGSST